MVVGWRNRDLEEGMKEEEKTILVGLEGVGFGAVERYVSLETAAAAPTVTEAMAV